MSVTYDESPKYWDDYLMWCRVNEVKPNLDHYDVWLDDRGIDEDSEDWTIGDNDVA
jgi:hypothetical protein